MNTFVIAGGSRGVSSLQRADWCTVGAGQEGELEEHQRRDGFEQVQVRAPQSDGVLTPLRWCRIDDIRSLRLQRALRLLNGNGRVQLGVLSFCTAEPCCRAFTRSLSETFLMLLGATLSRHALGWAHH